MSPVTHLLVGWTVANWANLERRDRMLVTVAGVIPDADGLGAVLDVIAPRPEQPWFWFEKLHHILGHNFAFCLLCMVAVAFFSVNRWLAVALAGISFHLHLLCDWALNSWPNIALTIGLIGWTFYLAWKRCYTPLKMLSTKADRAVVTALRQRFGKSSRIA